MSTAPVDRRTFLALGAGALGVAAAPSWLRPRERLVRLTVPVMGTIGELAIPARSEPVARQALHAAAAELRRIEGLMTRFQPHSDVGRFNAAPNGTTIEISYETAEVVRASLEWAEASGGAFDPTLERLTALWDPSHVLEPPDEGSVRGAVAETGGWRALDSGFPSRTAMAAEGRPSLVRAPGASLDLGGIAKGYGVDQAARVLREHGVFRGLVNVGGDLVALGDGPGGRPWRIGVRDPRGHEGTIQTLDITDAAVATSGDYLRFFEHDGERYHHILDPRTGSPVRSRIRTVTVVAADAMTADASATVAFAMGVERGADVLASRPGELRIAHSG
jgi:thiamine biosynthesis lipoprotein